MFIGLELRVTTMSWSLIFWDPHWKICSTIARESFLWRLCWCLL